MRFSVRLVPCDSCAIDSVKDALHGARILSRERMGQHHCLARAKKNQSDLQIVMSKLIVSLYSLPVLSCCDGDGVGVEEEALVSTVHAVACFNRSHVYQVWVSSHAKKKSLVVLTPMYG